MPKITRALISVTDKTGIVEFAKALLSHHIEILSTGGTTKLLRENSILVQDVSDYTGFPELLEGRLKTLHPKVAGGILGIRNNVCHQQEMKGNGILPIDLVVVNLYAFEKTVAKAGIALHEAIENIDIGGPTMLRAAAKNYQDVTVVVEPVDYKLIIDELKKNVGVMSEETNFKLARKVFKKTFHYDAAIHAYLSEQMKEEKATIFPNSFKLELEKIEDLRYGENPHQKAAWYTEIPKKEGTLSTAEKIQGKELSFNNLLDLQAAMAVISEFKDPACVIIKHTNPCGVAVSNNLKEAFLRAVDTDPVSSFGGIIGCNRALDGETARVIVDTFFECILAPDYDKEALEIFGAKRNLRLIRVPKFGVSQTNTACDYKKISGGMLIQECDESSLDLKTCAVPTQKKPTDALWKELEFAWKVSKHVKSNAIVFTRDGQVLGVGAGQMSRVDSVKIAVMKAQKSLDGSVLASDAFFPFRDGLDEAAQQKIVAVIQPGGSVRDAEVIQAADEHGLIMVFTGERHFKH